MTQKHRLFRPFRTDLTRCLQIFIQYVSLTTKVPGPVSSRVGVYVDHPAGTLSFYSVCDGALSLLHTVHTTFTQPLYAGIGIRLLRNGVTAELCKTW